MSRNNLILFLNISELKQLSIITNGECLNFDFFEEIITLLLKV